MADIQVSLCLRSTREPSKSKTMFFLTARSCWLRRLDQEWDTTRMLDLDSVLLSRPLSLTISIRSVPSLVVSPSEARFSRELLSRPRCREPLLSEEIIFITFQNTIVTRKGIAISLPIFHLLSQLKKETSCTSENADLSQKPFTSTCSRLLPMKLLETFANSLCSSDFYIINLIIN